MTKYNNLEAVRKSANILVFKNFTLYFMEILINVCECHQDIQNFHSHKNVTLRKLVQKSKNRKCNILQRVAEVEIL